MAGKKLKDFLKKEFHSPLARSVALMLVSALAGGLIVWAFYAYKAIDSDTTNGNLNSSEDQTAEKRDLVQEVNQSLKIVAPEGIDLNNFPPAIPIQLKLILEDGTDQGRDVTREADWGSADRGVVYVDNGNAKGEANGQKPGETVIFTKYKNMGATANVKVVRPELKISCRMNKKEAKVGEMVNYIIWFDEVGTPSYQYEIEGDDGFESDRAVDAYAYKTKGVKKVKMHVMDSMGTEAETECPPLLVR